METQLKVDFRGAEPSEAMHDAIAAQVESLEEIFGRLTACHVAVKVPGHHHQKGGPYEIDIHLILPDGREVNVDRTPNLDERHADIRFAVNDAFKRARRQLQDHIRRMQGQVKAHEGQPIGTILRFDPNTGYGFIGAADGHEVYFHKNSVVDATGAELSPGLRVRFAEEMGEKGAQATTVHLLGKHGMR